MTFTKAVWIILVVLGFHAAGLVFGLYGAWELYDVPMHFGGGFAMGALALAIWYQGIEDVHFKGRMARHLAPWLVPLFVLGFVSFIGIGWELLEFVLDQLFPVMTQGTEGGMRQVSLDDTMLDFVMDLLGGATALILFYRGR